jgi:hypothetical protein
MQLNPQTKSIIGIIEALGYRVEISRIKSRTKMVATIADGDEEWGIAATPLEAAKQLLVAIQR